MGIVESFPNRGPSTPAAKIGLPPLRMTRKRNAVSAQDDKVREVLPRLRMTRIKIELNLSRAAAAEILEACPHVTDFLLRESVQSRPL